ncbi:MAG: methyl-accepting chemotaxis protein [Gemmatimonadetes bacterium]|nr:methyl-accepting chemotaxis protein [Gemmatimonadota bacterium]
MNWTIGRRIFLVILIELVLLAAVATVAGVSLGRTRDAYERALTVRRTIVAPALIVESEIRGANVEQLRLVVVNDKRYERTRDSIVRLVQTQVKALGDTVQTEEQRKRWATVASLLDRWNKSMFDFAAADSAGHKAEALAIRGTRTEPLRAELDALIRDAVADAIKAGDAEAAAGATVAQRAFLTIWVGSLVAILIGIIAGYLVSQSINRPLRETANVIASSGAEILAATTEQAAGTNESMAAVTETVATVDEVAQTANQSAQRARMVADAAQRAAEGGRAGQKAVDDSVTAMQLVQTQVETMARGIVALAEQAQAIGEITTAVSDIAEQTKLLALNAAVESTRAGEHGRGFALVAAEIKALAGEAKESTTQVRRLLGEIQRATSAAVMATEQGTKQTAAAVRQVGQAGEIIGQLAASVEESAQAAAQILASAGQQALGMDQIRQAIANIHDATQQNLSATRQTELAAQNLTSMGGKLVDLVGARGGS